jgi:hypothetical protein
MPATGYRDIGVYQHKDGGGDAAKTGYVDIGVYQHQDAPAATPPGGAFSHVIYVSRMRQW